MNTAWMAKYGTRPVSEKMFWGHIICEIDTLDNHIDNIRTNFSGEYSFSDDKFAQIAAEYINSKIKDKVVHCDIGSSIAALSAKLTEFGWDSYAIDGCAYGLRNNLIKVPSERYSVFDMRQDISVFDLKKKFDLCTAFEVTEHIPKNDISAFVANIAHISKKLICTVHFGGEEQGSHYNIKPTTWWTDLLSKYGKVTMLDDMRALFPFEESDFMMVEFDD
jgi:hypothetical protein